MGEAQAGAESREPSERGGHRGEEAGEGSAAETWGPMEAGARTRDRALWLAACNVRTNAGRAV